VLAVCTLLFTGDTVEKGLRVPLPHLCAKYTTRVGISHNGAAWTPVCTQASKQQPTAVDGHFTQVARGLADLLP
jgi:hypothetical protein